MSSFCWAVRRTWSLPAVSARFCHRAEYVSRHSSDDGRDTDVVVAVALFVDANVVGTSDGSRRGRARLEGASQVLLLEHFAESLGTPVSDEELDAGSVAQTSVAVVAEDGHDAVPYLRDLVQRDKSTQALREHRVRRQTASQRTHRSPGPAQDVAHR